MQVADLKVKDGRKEEMKSPAQCHQGKGRKGLKGQTLVEYALLLALTSIVAIAMIIALGTNMQNIFNMITTTIAVAVNQTGS